MRTASYGGVLVSAKIPVSDNPELMAIWDWDTNTISPVELGKRSDIRVWWICPNGHDHYQQSPRQKMRRNMGCPKCNIEQRVRSRNAELLMQKGSIVSTYPDIAREWDHNRNAVSPYDVLAGSHTEFWWKCSQCGQSYLMSPNQRSSKDRGCPVCGIEMRGKAKRNNLLKKYGTLAETDALIANEWDYDRNSDTPCEVHRGMPDKRWWICDFGHPSYQQAIRDRVRRGYGCPLCQGECQTSFPEQAILYYIKKAFPDAQNRYVDSRFEIDIYIPQLKTGIEYDGYFWHRDKREWEQKKDYFFDQKGIRLLRVKETEDGDIFAAGPNVIWTKVTSDYRYLNSVIQKIASMLEARIDDIDVKRDRQAIWDQYISVRKENSLQAMFPCISNEWDYSKNTITPDKVSSYSRKKVNWVCPDCGNKYQMTIGDRTGEKKCGCPKCGFKKRNDKQLQIRKRNQRDIAEYRRNNPKATIMECSRSVGLSYPTVKKYWNSGEIE